MSETSAISGGFFQKHRTTLWEGAAVVGLVIGVVGLGAIVAAMGTSPHWYYTPNFDPNGTLPDGTPVYHGYHDPYDSSREYRIVFQKDYQIPFEIDSASQIQNVCQYGAQVGGVALGPCIAGFVLFAIALCARQYYKRRDDQEKQTTNIARVDAHDNDAATSANMKRRANIMIAVGIVFAAFSVGMLIASSTILNHGVSNMQELIEKGRNDFKFDYDKTFWDDLKSNWLDPTKEAMNGLVTAGTFGTLIFGALLTLGVFGRLGYGCFSCIKSCRAVVEPENTAVVTDDKEKQL